MKRFCECQMKCKEDTDETWTCTAHLAEGHVFTCCKKSLEDALKYPGRCEDAEPPDPPLGTLLVMDEKRVRK